MKILGISGSPRRDSVTARIVKKIVEASDLEGDFVSLAGKTIGPCIACFACAGDNICKVKDDMTDIRAKIVDADILVVGGTNTYSRLNSLTHSFFERFYQFHHQGNTSIVGKKGIAVGVGGGNGEPAAAGIEHFFKCTGIEHVLSISTRGPAPCLSCGYGFSCKISSASQSVPPVNQLEDDICAAAAEAGEKLKALSPL